VVVELGDVASRLAEGPSKTYGLIKRGLDRALHLDLDQAEGHPSRWITLRALRVLRWADGAERLSAATHASA